VRREQSSLVFGLVLASAIVLIPRPALAQAATITVVSFSPSSPQTFGTLLTITATVSSTSSPTGTVQFTDATTAQNLGTYNLTVFPSPTTSQVSISVSTLYPLTHNIQASYTPLDSNNYQSSSTTVPNFYTIIQINTLNNNPFTIVPNPSNALPSQGVQFTITSCGNLALPGCDVSVVPQGSVKLHVGNVYNQTLPLSNGSVVFTVPAGLLPSGVQNVSLDYADTGSADPWGSFTGVDTTTYTYLTAQTINFGALANQTYGAAPFAISATTSSNLAVSFASTTLSVCTVLGSLVTIVGGGQCSITASQAGNATYAAAPNVIQSFTVNPASQTIAFGALANQTYGAAPFAVSATASSTLAVTFASTTLSVCTVSGTTGTTVTLVGTGPCSITASQAGNANYKAATNVVQSFTVNKATLTVTAANAAKVYGAPVPVFTATFTGFVNGDTQASAVTGAPGLTTAATATSVPGSYPIVAMAGALAAANYSFVFVNGTLTIGKANTSTVLTNTATIVATVVPTAPGAGTPTGTVQFLNGSTVLATVALVNAQAALTNVPSGATVTAVYSGDGNFNGSNSTSGVVTQGPAVTSSISLTSSVNPASLGQTITFTAIVTGSASGYPTGSVQFLDGTKLLATVGLSSGQATYTTSSLSAGSHNIVAQYSGDSVFPPAQTVYGEAVFATVTMTVTAAPLTVVYGQGVTLTASISPTTPPAGFAAPSGQVTFQEGNTILGTATLSSGTASITLNTLAAGVDTITVTYSGDTTWGSAVRTISVTITQASSAASLQLALNSAGQVVLTATVTAVAPGAGTPTGSVQFTDTSNNAVIATAALSGGTTSATLTIAAAAHPIAALYLGDTDFKGSISGSLPVAISGVGIPASAFAPDEVVSLFNVTGLSGDTPATLPLTTTLGGVTVKILDSNNVGRSAQLYGVFASAGQINLVIPTGTAIGPALLTITLSNGGTLATALTMATTAPGLFTANMNGQGVYAGQVVHVHADGSQTIDSSATFNSQQNTYVPQPIALGPSTDQVFLVLYGTGIRGAATGQISVTIGGKTAILYYAGPQPVYPGLDQVNVDIPSGLAGAGTVNVVLTANGQAANTVTVAFQ